MAKSNARYITTEANRPLSELRCAIHGCPEQPAVGMFVCFDHGMSITRDFDQVLKMYAATPPKPTPQPEFPAFIYYLMLGPATVKIGTTRNLTDRVAQLRSEIQYVVAIERGSFDVERKRHLEFEAERISSREEFRLSDRLKIHIESLMPQRDELITEATARRRRELLADLQ
ncbi:GIY-YIG nuclease family protein [Mycolicibacterium fortuitum]|nr:GIY-YIG nuclease family protein [Mycolicibacterium fortuitum]